MTKGVVLIAGGHRNYGRMAMNCCMSIKAGSPDTNVTLLRHGDAGNHIALPGLFDRIIDLPEDVVSGSYLRPKVFLDRLSPYDETIFIDADVLFFVVKDIQNLFEELKDVEFTVGCRDGFLLSQSKSRMQWLEKEDLAQYFDGDPMVYNLSSEFMYFKKTEDVTELFDMARYYFDHPPQNHKRFAGGVPDELPFQMAISVCNKLKPHRVPFLPFFWYPFVKRNPSVGELYRSEYWGFSIGGNVMVKYQTDILESYAKFLSKKFGLRHPLICGHKKDWQPNRSKI